jgi:hypothetical protein
MYPEYERIQKFCRLAVMTSHLIGKQGNEKRYRA